MRIYVNGVGGNLGKELAPFFHSISAIRLSSRPAVGDICCTLEESIRSLKNMVFPGDIFIFMAAISKPGECARDPQKAWALNVELTRRLIRDLLDRGVQVIFFSSDAVYGQQQGVLSEQSPMETREEYGSMKRAIECDFSGCARFTALRLSYVITGRDSLSRYFENCAVNRLPVEVYRDFARNAVSIRDVEALLAALIKKTADGDELPCAINVGGRECLSRYALAERYSQAHAPDLEIMEVEAPAEFFDARPRTIKLDVGLMERLLGRKVAKLEYGYPQ